MRKPYLTFTLLLLLLACSVTGCAETPAARREALPTFSERTVLDLMYSASENLFYLFSVFSP